MDYVIIAWNDLITIVPGLDAVLEREIISQIYLIFLLKNKKKGISIYIFTA